jgi:hypothetical protein
VTIFLYLEFGTLALAGVLCCLAAMEDPHRRLELPHPPLPPRLRGETTRRLPIGHHAPLMTKQWVQGRHHRSGMSRI